MVGEPVQPHNMKAASIWGTAGTRYEKFSEHFGDAILHCIDRLAPRPGERILDVASGTGWGTRRIAALGAHAHGIDFAGDLVEAARRLTREAGLAVEFSIADAEHLPFEDASFDAVMSTFGVMFVQRPEAAAGELARVCRPGGRLALTTWPPDGTLARLTNDVLAPFRPPPPDPPPPSQFAWGRRDRVTELLASTFELRFETGCSVLRAPSGEQVWELWRGNHGPTMATLAALPAGRRGQLRDAFVAYHERFRDERGVAMPRDYLLTLGTRKQGD